ncbi:MAG: sucrose synthase, partial [Proteobacteria bacterium]|nr:sucrose synthase [Pseudomonadota bacterium]
MLGSELWDEFNAFCHETGESELVNSPLANALRKTQEAAVADAWFYLDIRPAVAQWQYMRYHFETMSFEEISVTEFLAFKENLINTEKDERILEIDLAPFERDFPKMNQTRSIGHGVEFLNRRFSSRLANELTKGDELLLEFLRVHGYQNTPFMINGSITSVNKLRTALIQGMEFVSRQNRSLEWQDLEQDFRGIGFEAGWGRSMDGIKKTMSLLADLLEAPDHQNLENFLDRIPMIFNIVILSPHGYFGQ